MSCPRWIKDLACQCRTECDATTYGKDMNLMPAPEQLRPAAAEFLRHGYFLEDVTGSDMKEGFLVMYHFAHFDLPGRYSLMVLVPHEDPRLPTIADIYQGANWHERECYDMYGLIFTDHPNLLPLLLPAETDLHPLVKEEKKRSLLSSVLPLCRFPGIPVEKQSAESTGEDAQ